MGYSIDADTYDKLERNRREGRECRGGSRYCTTRATRRVFMDTWMNESDKAAGEAPRIPADEDKGMTLCTRHTNTLGIEGLNFTVRRIERI
jgi:hypothetical protein